MKTTRLVLVLLSIPAAAFSQERPADPSLSLLFASFSQARQAFHFRREPSAQAPAPSDGRLILWERWAEFSRPDGGALGEIRTRIKDLNTENIRVVPLDKVEGVLQRALQRRLTYLDVLTDAALRRNEIYYVPQGVLQAIGRKYTAGILPYSGQDTKGRSFQLKALIVGQGRIEFLYDALEEFQFKADGEIFKVKKGGRVSGRVEGPGVVGGLSGLQVKYGFFWPTFQKWTKKGDKVRVDTDKGGGEFKLPAVALK